MSDNYFLDKSTKCTHSIRPNEKQYNDIAIKYDHNVVRVKRYKNAVSKETRQTIEIDVTDYDPLANVKKSNDTDIENALLKCISTLQAELLKLRENSK